MNKVEETNHQDTNERIASPGQKSERTGSVKKKGPGKGSITFRRSKRPKKDERKYAELLNMSTEIEREIDALEEKKFGSLDEYSVNEKLLIFQNEFINQIKSTNEYRDSLQRIAADFDNYRKRNEKERGDIISHANEKLLLKLLSVLDNLDRAMTTGKNGIPEDDPFYQGIKLIHSQFNKVITEEGLTPINETGVLFDPYRHDAMMRVVNNEIDDNTVTDIFLNGYVLKDKVIRPAQVRISKKEE